MNDTTKPEERPQLDADVIKRWLHINSHKLPKTEAEQLVVLFPSKTIELKPPR
jgi:hypothetical protein